MKTENKRIFINDLPETVTQEELERKFSNYGEVSSVEIKERKDLGLHNKTLFFAYVNLITNDKDLNQCFKELSKTKWHGQYVELQIARESFLDRLKRERQENESNKQNKEILPQSEVNLVQKQNETKIKISNNKNDTQKSQPTPEKKAIKNNISIPITKIESESNCDSDNVIRKICNSDKAAKVIDKNKLKIPSVGKEPIMIITKAKIKANDSEANMRRLQTLKDMKKDYAAKKSFIKNSLSYDVNNSKPNSKILFDDKDDSVDSNEKLPQNGLTKTSLFDNDKSEDDSDFEVNFELKEQFEGRSGQKLLELQSKYKNDKRFALDERFIEDENNHETEARESENISEETIAAEKKAQLKILGEVLGRPIPIHSKEENKKDSVRKKTMLRFDPSQPDHSNLEVVISESEQKTKKRKTEKKETPEILNPEPEVSKEMFYKVTNNLKETFDEKQQFSLLNMFGKVQEEKEDIEMPSENLRQNPIIKGPNPFKYDSSDDENNIEDIPHQSQTGKTSQSNPEVPNRATPSVFWTEPFFFKNDDFRLQEGLDFLEKIKSENKEFMKIRRDLKGIVKAKVRNNERKNKMFKKKLGGSKRRKHIRIKKALKR